MLFECPLSVTKDIPERLIMLDGINDHISMAVCLAIRVYVVDSQQHLCSKELSKKYICIIDEYQMGLLNHHHLLETREPNYRCTSLCHRGAMMAFHGGLRVLLGLSFPCLSEIHARGAWKRDNFSHHVAPLLPMSTPTLLAKTFIRLRIVRISMRCASGAVSVVFGGSILVFGFAF